MAEGFSGPGRGWAARPARTRSARSRTDDLTPLSPHPRIPILEARDLTQPLATPLPAIRTRNPLGLPRGGAFAGPRKGPAAGGAGCDHPPRASRRTRGLRHPTPRSQSAPSASGTSHNAVRCATPGRHPDPQAPRARGHLKGGSRQEQADRDSLSPPAEPTARRPPRRFDELGHRPFVVIWQRRWNE